MRGHSSPRRHRRAAPHGPGPGARRVLPLSRRAPEVSGGALACRRAAKNVPRNRAPPDQRTVNPLRGKERVLPGKQQPFWSTVFRLRDFGSRSGGLRAGGRPGRGRPLRKTG